MAQGHSSAAEAALTLGPQILKQDTDCLQASLPLRDTWLLRAHHLIRPSAIFPGGQASLRPAENEDSLRPLPSDSTYSGVTVRP